MGNDINQAWQVCTDLRHRRDGLCRVDGDANARFDGGDRFGFLRCCRHRIAGLALEATPSAAMDCRPGKSGASAHRELRLLPASGAGGPAYFAEVGVFVIGQLADVAAKAQRHAPDFVNFGVTPTAPIGTAPLATVPHVQSIPNL